MKYEAVIGLEIHCELKTKTKIFCGCATGFGAEQNTHVCPVCLGLPGVLPTVNKRVVEFGIKAGLATNCTINKYSKFDRKTTTIRTCRRTGRRPSTTCRSLSTAGSTSTSTVRRSASA